MERGIAALLPEMSVSTAGDANMLPMNDESIKPCSSTLTVDILGILDILCLLDHSETASKRS